MKMKTLLKLGCCFASMLLVNNAFAYNSVPSNTTTKHHSTSSRYTKETKNFLSDAEITAKIKQRYIQEKLFDKERISAMGVHVKTINRIVYLRGKVDNQEQKDNAIYIAKSIPDVKEVRSQIRVKRTHT